MRKYLLTLTALFLFSLNHAQDFEKAADAFEEGDARAIASLLDATVDVTIDGTSSTVGRGDAESKLRTFFMNHEPKNFETMHTGDSDGDVRYMIGYLMTSDGAYRITIYMHKTLQDYLIKTMEFEKE